MAKKLLKKLEFASLVREVRLHLRRQLNLKKICVAEDHSGVELGFIEVISAKSKGKVENIRPSVKPLISTSKVSHANSGLGRQ